MPGDSLRAFISARRVVVATHAGRDVCEGLRDGCAFLVIDLAGSSFVRH